jgi:hypothetical protein
MVEVLVEVVVLMLVELTVMIQVVEMGQVEVGLGDTIFRLAALVWGILKVRLNLEFVLVLQ